MTWLSDSTELIAGAWLSSAYPGHGILGADVPTTGDSGPGPIYQRLSLPGDAGKEYRLLIETVPPLLTLWSYTEGDTLTAAGPDGVHVGSGRLFQDGVDLGTVTITITIGSGSSGPLSGTATLDGLSASGGLASGPSVLSGTAVLDGLSASGGAAGVGASYAMQPDTAASWSYLQTATLWSITGRDDWTGAPTYAAPVWFLCDYASESRRMTDARGVEFTSRHLVYTSLTGVKQGDMVLLAASSVADPIAAGASEVKAVAAWADTFNAGGPEDYRLAT